SSTGPWCPQHHRLSLPFKGSMYTKFAVAGHLARPSTDEGGRNGRAVGALLWHARPHPESARPQPWLSLKAPVAAAPPKRHRRTSCGPQAHAYPLVPPAMPRFLSSKANWRRCMGVEPTLDQDFNPGRATRLKTAHGLLLSA